MKPGHLIEIFILLTIIPVVSHEVKASEAINFSSEHIICGAFGHPDFKNVKRLHKPSQEAIKALEWLTGSIGIEPNFVVLGAELEENADFIAFAAIRNNQRYIVYDSANMFVSANDTMTWVDLAIMAHEIGHHTSGVTAVGAKSSYAGELEADRSAGHMLRLLGATFDQALVWTRYKREEATATHPGRKERTQAVIEGWENAERMLNEPPKPIRQ